MDRCSLSDYELKGSSVSIYPAGTNFWIFRGYCVRRGVKKYDINLKDHSEE